MSKPALTFTQLLEEARGNEKSVTQTGWLDNEIVSYLDNCFLEDRDDVASFALIEGKNVQTQLDHIDKLLPQIDFSGKRYIVSAFRVGGNHFISAVVDLKANPPVIRVTNSLAGYESQMKEVSDGIQAALKKHGIIKKDCKVETNSPANNQAVIQDDGATCGFWTAFHNLLSVTDFSKTEQKQKIAELVKYYFGKEIDVKSINTREALVKEVEKKSRGYTKSTLKKSRAIAKINTDAQQGFTSKYYYSDQKEIAETFHFIDRVIKYAKDFVRREYSADEPTGEEKGLVKYQNLAGRLAELLEPPTSANSQWNQQFKYNTSLVPKKPLSRVSFADHIRSTGFDYQLEIFDLVKVFVASKKGKIDEKAVIAFVEQHKENQIFLFRNDPILNFVSEILNYKGDRRNLPQLNQLLLDATKGFKGGKKAAKEDQLITLIRDFLNKKTGPKDVDSFIDANLTTINAIIAENYTQATLAPKDISGYFVSSLKDKQPPKPKAAATLSAAERQEMEILFGNLDHDHFVVTIKQEESLPEKKETIFRLVYDPLEDYYYGISANIKDGSAKPILYDQHRYVKIKSLGLTAQQEVIAKNYKKTPLSKRFNSNNLRFEDSDGKELQALRKKYKDIGGELWLLTGGFYLKQEDLYQDVKISESKTYRFYYNFKICELKDGKLTPLVEKYDEVLKKIQDHYIKKEEKKPEQPPAADKDKTQPPKAAAATQDKPRPKKLIDQAKQYHPEIEKQIQDWQSEMAEDEYNDFLKGNAEAYLKNDHVARTVNFFLLKRKNVAVVEKVSVLAQETAASSKRGLADTGGLDSVYEIIKSGNFEGKDFIVFPLLRGGHFTSVVINLKDPSIILADSMGGMNIDDERFTKLKKVLDEKFKDVGKIFRIELIKEEERLVQKDGHSCGFFACLHNCLAVLDVKKDEDKKELVKIVNFLFAKDVLDVKKFPAKKDLLQILQQQYEGCNRAARIDIERRIAMTSIIDKFHVSHYLDQNTATPLSQLQNSEVPSNPFFKKHGDFSRLSSFLAETMRSISDQRKPDFLKEENKQEFYNLCLNALNEHKKLSQKHLYWTSQANSSYSVQPSNIERYMDELLTLPDGASPFLKQVRDFINSNDNREKPISDDLATAFWQQYKLKPAASTEVLADDQDEVKKVDPAVIEELVLSILLEYEQSEEGEKLKKPEERSEEYFRNAMKSLLSILQNLENTDRCRQIANDTLKRFFEICPTTHFSELLVETENTKLNEKFPTIQAFFDEERLYLNMILLAEHDDFGNDEILKYINNKNVNPFAKRGNSDIFSIFIPVIQDKDVVLAFLKSKFCNAENFKAEHYKLLIDHQNDYIDEINKILDGKGLLNGVLTEISDSSANSEKSDGSKTLSDDLLGKVGDGSAVLALPPKSFDELMKDAVSAAAPEDRPNFAQFLPKARPLALGASDTGAKDVALEAAKPPATTAAEYKAMSKSVYDLSRWMGKTKTKTITLVVDDASSPSASPRLGGGKLSRQTSSSRLMDDEVSSPESGSRHGAGSPTFLG